LNINFNADQSIDPPGLNFEPPGLHWERFDPLKLLNFDFIAAPDPDFAYQSNADSDAATRNNADPDPQQKRIQEA
jgi:hypothetical protein